MQQKNYYLLNEFQIVMSFVNVIGLCYDTALSKYVNEYVIQSSNPM